MLRYKTDPDAYDRVLEAAEIIRKGHPDTNMIGIPDPVNGHFWRNLALGVSIENQATADERVPVLLQTPAAKRFVSYEPALGPVDLWAIGDGSWYDREGADRYNALSGASWWGGDGDHGLGGGPKLDLVIMGGESGPKARPMHPDWARSMRDQCQSAGVPFMFKQWGEWLPDDHFTLSIGRSLKRTPSEDLIPDYSRPLNHSAFKVGKKASGRLIDGIEHNGTINWEA